ncbi:hypothetical protein EB796_023800 [Bugula neritina]|uniref:Uncharacterized protein n=1 Tax=Bugula neritina TaxID=10212 RepID=A0A7J7IVF8_BUGNE|nr:hypothetical protein EB796_023800 [Bugula neritina]
MLPSSSVFVSLVRICPILYITTALTPTLPATMSVRYLMYSISVVVLTSFILVNLVYVVTANLVGIHMHVVHVLVLCKLTIY